MIDIVWRWVADRVLTPSARRYIVGEPTQGSGYDDDALYGDLHDARERLCRAQTHVPVHWKSDLQAAIDHVDLAGSSLCPRQWSRFDQPRVG